MIPDIYVHSCSGALINLREIDPAEITLEAIVHTLSQKNRWDARTLHPWSVLQHSLMLGTMVPRHLARQALYHDFCEGFIPDFPYPLKSAYPVLDELEQHVRLQVQGVLALGDIEHEVWVADNEIRVLESERLFPGQAPTRRPHPYMDFLLQCSPDAVRSIFFDKWARS